ncbi:MAG: hypothetical protein O2960_18710 [Verrucomicrobia bacterium]|nr:hypothetical protein [Verrucomicrobiota bacterium]
MKTPTPFCRPASPRTPRIELDTPLVPWAVAVCVCEEVGVCLDQPLPRRWVRELTARANTIYAHNARFRRRIRGKGTSGRDYLWMFMRHWLSALLWERRPHLHARLPSDYCVGRPLPPKPSAPLRQLKTARRNPLPAGPRRRPRAAPDYAFAAAAHFSFP